MLFVLDIYMGVRKVCMDSIGEPGRYAWLKIYSNHTRASLRHSRTLLRHEIRFPAQESTHVHRRLDTASIPPVHTQLFYNETHLIAPCLIYAATRRVTFNHGL